MHKHGNKLTLPRCGQKIQVEAVAGVAPNDYTHKLFIWEWISQLDRTSVTQGLLAGHLFV